jgi:peptidoglycan/LPS O-acetylase OafA/YrhL
MATRANNFDALRLLGALLVAVGHSMDIFTGHDWLGAATSNQSLGGLGLNIFCVISGYLITKSRLRNDARDFAVSRALRILPALLVAMPLMAFVMGPLVTALPLGAYVGSGQTWRFLTSALVFPLNPALPGVFGGIQLIGQLYSLTAEVAFYIFVGSLGAWKQFPKLVAVLFVGMWIVFLRTDYVSMPFTRIADLTIGSTTVFFFPVRLGSLCMFYLLAGSALALFGPDPAKLAGAATPLLVIWLVALWNPDRRVYDMVEMTLLPLVVLGVGLMSLYVVQIPRVIGDISYGTYIYHFAVAEWVFAWGPASLHNATGILPAVGLAALAGWLSFHFVEKRALAHKSARVSAAVADMSVAAQAAITA